MSVPEVVKTTKQDVFEALLSKYCESEEVLINQLSANPEAQIENLNKRIQQWQDAYEKAE